MKRVEINGEKMVFTVKDLLAILALMGSLAGIFIGFSARVRAMELGLTERLVRIESKLETHMDPVMGIHETPEQKKERIREEITHHEERLHK